MKTKKFLNVLNVLLICLFCCTVKPANAQTYPKLSESVLTFQGDKDKWDDNKVHTLFVVEANKDGYKYWGYYALSHYGGDPNLRNAGLVRSNDLEHWTKYEGNPIIKGDCRWPSVIYTNNTFYMFYAEYNADTDSRIVMVTSKDGIHFDNKVEIVPRESGKQNQNPNIFYNKKDKSFYLTYYNGLERDILAKDAGEDKTKLEKKYWKIAVKKSKNIEGLKKAASKTLLSADYTLAAPSLTYYKNKYYLIAEAYKVSKWGEKWVTVAYESNKADGKYKEVKNGLVLSDNDACAFQHVFNNKLYVFYSHCLDLANWNWELRMKKAIE
jgi:hypothetical protein